ncbi:MAG: HEAT repeat domain-containing protein [Euryarchaeota archaeon]
MTSTTHKALDYALAEVRTKVAYALGNICDTAAVKLLIQALGDSDSTVLGNAAYALE